MTENQTVPAAIVEKATQAITEHRFIIGLDSVPYCSCGWRAKSMYGIEEFDTHLATRALKAVYADIQAEALREAADAMILPGSNATGYYSSEQHSGYRDAESDAEQWLRARADRLAGA